MVENENNEHGNRNQRITVKAPDVDGIVEALGLELVEEPEPAEPPYYPEELRDVLDTLAGHPWALEHT